MKLITATALAATALFSTAAHAQEKVEIGRLECTVEGGIGLIIGSSKDAVCSFYDSEAAEPVDVYYGKVNKVGLDVGFTEESVIQWLVLAPSTDAYSSGSLAGQYVGASAEVSLGLGAGANVLVGGSNDGFMLQPLSVQGQTGINVAVGITGFQLRTPTE
ncbi:DUF992 domain-containing protein [Devosia sp. J2-20]|jgi:hypothetical protein|uniref:DUF992 domain-containing protein n=3 Tax=Devosia TaxID=46913 RepID=A0A942E900_9HYPH|nr:MULTISPECIES: DUF992 domain-containing protein [Devosia]MBS3847752.1 DUF992 domain-containing protein [Devosia litorisediminis]MCZ4345728.1 DUF992 domain-containing protein [Devosia neptuniae]WDQ99133.1 DUF992 domain-containing protein [Devosia sp. J2-20]|tara:strand:- start:1130 stop:1609 length:480 start_codon:yes stop_codon:yes gene_type:complete